jgi:hypothetical protein
MHLARGTQIMSHLGKAGKLDQHDLAGPTAQGHVRGCGSRYRDQILIKSKRVFQEQWEVELISSFNPLSIDAQLRRAGHYEIRSKMEPIVESHCSSDSMLLLSKNMDVFVCSNTCQAHGVAQPCAPALSSLPFWLNFGINPDGW